MDASDIALANIKNKTRLKGKKAAVVICYVAEIFKKKSSDDVKIVPCKDCGREIVREYLDSKMVRKNAKYICILCATKPEYFNDQEEGTKTMILNGVQRYIVKKDLNTGGLMVREMLTDLFGGDRE